MRIQRNNKQTASSAGKHEWLVLVVNLIDWEGSVFFLFFFVFFFLTSIIAKYSKTSAVQNYLRRLVESFTVDFKLSEAEKADFKNDGAV